MAFHLNPLPTRRAAALWALGLASAALASTALAQTQSPSEAPEPPASSVTVTGRTLTLGSLSPWSLPAREQPLTTSSLQADDIALRGARRLADLIGMDSSLSDAYNAVGYIDYLTVRGFVIDNRYNVRREGLPINGDTAIGLDNKAAVEVLKGTSGLQAGTSAPGGLVNYRVKRPWSDAELAGSGLQGTARLEAGSRASVLSALDLGGRWGAQGESAGERPFGWRLNLADERLRPTLHNADGQRQLAALATEWRLSPRTLLEAEGEWSRRRQPTQSGFSLLGDTLPAPSQPRLNLNNQPWSLPTVFEGHTGSLRFSHELNDHWRLVAQAGTQGLRTDDRVAFAYGVYNPDTFECNPCDRFGADGRFSVWDFRSENERRRTDAQQLELMGKAQLAGLSHELRLGLGRSRQRIDLQPQAFNLVGQGQVDGSVVLPADPTPYDPSTNRRERSTELFLQDAIGLNTHARLWLGLRHTRLHRESIRTDGSRPTQYAQSLTTPWVAFTHALPGQALVFISRGEGAESQVVPNRPKQYTNAGQALPALKSVQWELGLRQGDIARQGWQWQATAFRITRPTSNLDACANLGLSPCTGQNDGDVRHQGLELGTQAQLQSWRLGLQGTWLSAQRRGSQVQPELNGLAPVNVPERVLRASARYDAAQLPGLSLQAQWSFEGSRQLLPDNSRQLPSWHRSDVQLRYALPQQPIELNAGVDNLFDQRYWRESPYQFGHVYLYPGAVRTWRAGLTVSF